MTKVIKLRRNNSLNRQKIVTRDEVNKLKIRKTQLLDELKQLRGRVTRLQQKVQSGSAFHNFTKISNPQYSPPNKNQFNQYNNFRYYLQKKHNDASNQKSTIQPPNNDKTNDKNNKSARQKIRKNRAEQTTNSNDTKNQQNQKDITIYDDFDQLDQNEINYIIANGFHGYGGGDENSLSQMLQSRYDILQYTIEKQKNEINEIKEADDTQKYAELEEELKTINEELCRLQETKIQLRKEVIESFEEFNNVLNSIGLQTKNLHEFQNDDNDKDPIRKTKKAKMTKLKKADYCYSDEIDDFYSVENIPSPNKILTALKSTIRSQKAKLARRDKILEKYNTVNAKLEKKLDQLETLDEAKSKYEIRINEAKIAEAIYKRKLYEEKLKNTKIEHPKIMQELRQKLENREINWENVDLSSDDDESDEISDELQQKVQKILNEYKSPGSTKSQSHKSTQNTTNLDNEQEIDNLNSTQNDNLSFKSKDNKSHLSSTNQSNSTDKQNNNQQRSQDSIKNEQTTNISSHFEDENKSESQHLDETTNEKENGDNLKRSENVESAHEMNSDFVDENSNAEKATTSQNDNENDDNLKQSENVESTNEMNSDFVSEKETIQDAPKTNQSNDKEAQIPTSQDKETLTNALNSRIGELLIDIESEKHEEQPNYESNDFNETPTNNESLNNPHEEQTNDVSQSTRELHDAIHDTDKLVKDREIEFLNLDSTGTSNADSTSNPHKADEFELVNIDSADNNDNNSNSKEINDDKFIEINFPENDDQSNSSKPGDTDNHEIIDFNESTDDNHIEKDNSKEELLINESDKSSENGNKADEEETINGKDDLKKIETDSVGFVNHDKNLPATETEADEFTTDTNVNHSDLINIYSFDYETFDSQVKSSDPGILNHEAIKNCDAFPSYEISLDELEQDNKGEIDNEEVNIENLELDNKGEIDNEEVNIEDSEQSNKGEIDNEEVNIENSEQRNKGSIDEIVVTVDES